MSPAGCLDQKAGCVYPRFPPLPHKPLPKPTLRLSSLSLSLLSPPMAQSVILRALLRRNLSSSGLLLPLSTLLSKTPPPPTPIKPNCNSDTLPSLLNNPYSVIIPSTFFSSSSHQPNLHQEPKKNKNKKKNKPPKKSGIDFTKIDSALLPTVIIVGRPNVGKSALFNRLIGRREALFGFSNSHFKQKMVRA